MGKIVKLSFKQMVGKIGFFKVTNMPHRKYEASLEQFWSIFSKLFGIRGKTTKQSVGKSKEEFISKYFWDNKKERTLRFADYLRDIWILSETYDVLPGMQEEYDECITEWKELTDIGIFELITPDNFVEIFPVTFDELAKLAKFVDKKGNIVPSRVGAYTRMWNVFQVSFDTNDKEIQVYLERNPYDYVKLNGFSPNGSIKSIAKYLQQIGVLDESYSKLNQELFDFYKKFWEEIRETNRTVYEIVDGEMMKRFKDESEARLEQESYL